MTVYFKKYADCIGMAASGLCLVHCLFMPFILVFWLQTGHCTAGADGRTATPGFNYDYLFLAFSAIAVWLVSGHCSRYWIKALMWGSFTLLAGGILLEPLLEGTHQATIFAAVVARMDSSDTPKPLTWEVLRDIKYKKSTTKNTNANKFVYQPYAAEALKQTKNEKKI